MYRLLDAGSRDYCKTAWANEIVRTFKACLCIGYLMRAAYWSRDYCKTARANEIVQKCYNTCCRLMKLMKVTWLMHVWMFLNISCEWLHWVLLLLLNSSSIFPPGLPEHWLIESGKPLNSITNMIVYFSWLHLYQLYAYVSFCLYIWLSIFQSV